MALVAGDRPRKPLYRVLYVQVLAAIALAIVVGHFWPDAGVQMKPLGDGFIKLIKMVIPLVIFFTVVSGICGMASMKKVGAIGGKALVYFELVSTFALLIGLLVGNWLKPGAGFNAILTADDAKAVEQYAGQAQDQTVSEFLLNVIPRTMVDAFAKGDILPVVLLSLLVGFALVGSGERGRPLRELIESGGDTVFRIINMLMKLAPIGAFGAMAFTVGRYGVESLGPLVKLIGIFYLTSAIFVIGVLGTIGWVCRFNIFRLLAYIKEEILIVLGTSSSDTALPTLMKKLEDAGCSKSVVGLVVPTGYVFNTDGTSIYMTLAALFVAQATNTDLTLMQQLALFGVAGTDVEGRQRRHRRLVHRPGRHALGGARHPPGRHGADPRHRPLHERGPRPGEHDRQRRGHRGHGPHRRRAGRGTAQARALRQAPAAGARP